jgi:hypothetical protein
MTPLVVDAFNEIEDFDLPSSRMALTIYIF